MATVPTSARVHALESTGHTHEVAPSQQKRARSTLAGALSAEPAAKARRTDGVETTSQIRAETHVAATCAPEPSRVSVQLARLLKKGAAAQVPLLQPLPWRKATILARLVDVCLSELQLTCRQAGALVAHIGDYEPIHVDLVWHALRRENGIRFSKLEEKAEGARGWWRDWDAIADILRRVHSAYTLALDAPDKSIGPEACFEVHATCDASGVSGLPVVFGDALSFERLPLLVVSERGSVQHANRSWVRLSGWSLRRCVGAPVSDVLEGPATDRAATAALARAALCDAGCACATVTCHASDGSPYVRRLVARRLKRCSWFVVALA